MSQAVVIATGVSATGVSADGRREVLGCAVGDSETEAFWAEFLRGLRDRGLGGVQLVISDAHRGLVNAVDTVLQGSAWQRCRVHFMRNALAKVGKGHQEMVAATIGTIFAQPGPAEVHAHVDLVADTLHRQFPAVTELLLAAKTDLTAFADFPHAHWRKIWSTNPIERLNREVKRRTDVVGIFPNPSALLRLSACVLIEAHDQWQVSDRRYLPEETTALLTPAAPTPLTTPPPTTLTKELAATAESPSPQSSTRRATPPHGTPSSNLGDLVQPTGRHAHHQVVGVVVGQREPAAVDAEKRDRRSERKSLVPVNQRLVASEGVQQCGGLVVELGIGIGAEHRGLRPRQR